MGFSDRIQELTSRTWGDKLTPHHSLLAISRHGIGNLHSTQVTVAQINFCQLPVFGADLLDDEFFAAHWNFHDMSFNGFADNHLADFMLATVYNEAFFQQTNGFLFDNARSVYVIKAIAL